jgi:hypothetical protein
VCILYKEGEKEALKMAYKIKERRDDAKMIILTY